MDQDQITLEGPAAPGTAAPPDASPKDVPPTNASMVRRVLIVDDDVFQQRTITRRLDALGYANDCAGTLAEAAARLAHAPYDAVLLDLSLGEADGISLLQAVRDSRSDPAVIIVSGLEDRVRSASFRLAEALGLRVGGSLRKPVTQDDLRGALDRLPIRSAHGSATSGQPPSKRPVISALELERAVSKREIAVRYQPKVCLRHGHTVGFEALARWPSDAPHAVSPDVFIPLAEKNNLIIPLTFHVLAEALATCRRWRVRNPACSVAVNISPLVLADPSLPEEIERMLRDAGLGAGALVAEITESTVIQHPLIAAEVLTRLRIKGVRLSIDDFGTGHSSLLSLLKLPFSELKIDKSFISQCDVDPDAWKIARATISMARELGLTVVAEGVERPEIADMLRQVGCDVGQGWLFARAMDAIALEAWLAAQPAAPV